ncbi:serine O-acetyltransferase EpsC [Sedimentisphaera salicampi]|uniref:serine O-acetyltransferase n=1 Tax=Sedimentisphaera salicampi TaxID=1941349 RepID=A0A1W6LK18_9BACT|nr:serine O-acetyltransferase EpsC [Sedimentisphaera salicampi]ARN56109.1 Serine acetyltransferase [Sedimentisphaera salicampi]OXU15841.1 Serine acetyltransferase [Sedimentisphaera salicampi]
MGNTSEMVKKIVDSCLDNRAVNFCENKNLPHRREIELCLADILEVLFPGYSGRYSIRSDNIEYVIGGLLCSIKEKLSRQTLLALKYQCPHEPEDICQQCVSASKKAVDDFIEKIPSIREVLKTDIEAAYEGDPAAQTKEEIVISYPGLRCIAVHRVAHEFYKAGVPLIPRIMSENAHQVTGIDIHPGADIGNYFFIDHGTGVVIGETAVIGEHVKIYQGVTLGALSFKKDSEGNIIKGGKRHPTIEDNVTIYAEATILGDVVIGEGSVIAGNTWVKESVEPGQTVMSVNPELVIRGKRKNKKP